MNTLFSIVTVALFVAAICVCGGCAGQDQVLSGGVRILTPYGTIDTTTSGTSELDLRGLMAPKQQLEK